MNERQRGAAAFGLAVIGAVVAPVVRNFQRNPVDSFPLSHYPMFSAAHPELLDVTHLIGVTASGKRVPLRCSLLGPGGMNQLRTQIRRAATGPRPERTTDRIAGASRTMRHTPTSCVSTWSPADTESVTGSAGNSPR